MIIEISMPKKSLNTFMGIEGGDLEIILTIDDKLEFCDPISFSQAQYPFYREKYLS